MSTLPRPRHAAIALTVAAVLGTTACGTDDEPTTSGRAPLATSTVPSGAEDSELDQPVGAVDMLSDFDCAPRGGTWRGRAKLTNASDERASFEVTFTVIRTQGNAVVGEKTMTYDLAAGESTAVRIDDLHDQDEDGLQCVRRVLTNS